MARIHPQDIKINSVVYAVINHDDDITSLVCGKVKFLGSGVNEKGDFDVIFFQDGGTHRMIYPMNRIRFYKNRKDFLLDEIATLTDKKCDIIESINILKSKL